MLLTCWLVTNITSLWLQNLLSLENQVYFENKLKSVSNHNEKVIMLIEFDYISIQIKKSEMNTHEIGPDRVMNLSPRIDLRRLWLHHSRRSLIGWFQSVPPIQLSLQLLFPSFKLVTVQFHLRRKSDNRIRPFEIISFRSAWANLVSRCEKCSNRKCTLKYINYYLIPYGDWTRSKIQSLSFLLRGGELGNDSHLTFSTILYCILKSSKSKCIYTETPYFWKK